IFLETNLFYQGIRPAISVGLSVSRVGGAAQTKAVKSVAGSLRLNLAQFRELAAFAQFSTDLDAETKHRIDRGQRLTELLKQPQYSPYSVWEQTAMLMSATEGAFDKVAVDKIGSAKEGLLARLNSKHSKVMSELNKGDKPTDAMKKTILDSAKTIAEEYRCAESIK
ncbi:MAG: F0F1 ATP synthase subunit alpha, partial [Patescibacteria group bacterium]